MAFLTTVFTLVITVGLPMFGVFYLFDRDKAFLKSLGAGVVAYAIPQVLSIVPPFSDLDAILGPYGLASATFGKSLIFALVIEVVRYLIVRYYLTDRRKRLDVAAVGFGHWGMEAILTVGLTVFVLLLSWSQNGPLVDPTNMMLSGLERLFVLPVMLLLSALTFRADKTGGQQWAALGVLINTLLNGGTSFLVAGGLSSSIVIWLMGVVGLVCGLFAYRLITGRAK